MSQSRSERFSIRHALGLSTALHALIAPLFVVSSVAFVGAGQSAEPLGFRSGDMAAITTMTIEHRAQHVVRAETPHPARAERTAPKRVRPVARRATSVDTPAQGSARATSPRGHVLQAEGSAVLSVVRNRIVTEPVEAATLAPKSETPPAEPAAAPAPASQPTAAAVALTSSVQAASGRGYDSPNGGWGQYFERPLVADEGALNDLRSKYRFSATITVSVDEAGHATKVIFPNSVPAEARSEIEKRLTALHYVPAECNGLRCPASLSIVI